MTYILRTQNPIYTLGTTKSHKDFHNILIQAHKEEYEDEGLPTQTSTLPTRRVVPIIVTSVWVFFKKKKNYINIFLVPNFDELCWWLSIYVYAAIKLCIHFKFRWPNFGPNTLMIFIDKSKHIKQIAYEAQYYTKTSKRHQMQYGRNILSSISTTIQNG